MKKLLLLVALLPVVCGGCHHGMLSEVKGSGNRKTEARQVASFTAIETEGALDLNVVCGKDLRLEVEADDNILPLISTAVSGNKLIIKPTRSYSSSDPPSIKITVPNINAFSANGAGSIQITGVNNDQIQFYANGAPTISASGTTKMVGVDVNGAAKIDTHNLRSDHAVVDSKGVSKVELGVCNRLDATVSGPSNVTYRGDPVVNKTIHGPGKVEKRSDEGA
jgi:hypothetical protein